MSRTVLVIVGPTGVGKTGVSLELAKRLDCEVISADSRQVYKYMNIGTAKPTREELAAVPHHFIDIKLPDQRYSAGEFGDEARACVADIFSRGKQPVVVGGSGLYIRGLVDGFSGHRIADENVKAALQDELRQRGTATLYARLQAVDAETAANLNRTDTQRILRALEVFEITGTPLSEYLKKTPAPADFESIFFGLTMPRVELYKRITQRVDTMISAGLVEEVRALEEMGYGPGLNALRTVGYQEVFMHFKGDLTYDEMVLLIKQKTRNYAKRQLTWFRKDTRVRWLDRSNFRSSAELATHIHNALLGSSEWMTAK